MDEQQVVPETVKEKMKRQADALRDFNEGISLLADTDRKRIILGVENEDGGLDIIETMDFFSRFVKIER